MCAYMPPVAALVGSYIWRGTMGAVAQPWPIWVGRNIVPFLVQLICRAATGLATSFKHKPEPMETQVGPRRSLCCLYCWMRKL